MTDVKGNDDVQPPNPSSNDGNSKFLLKREEITDVQVPVEEKNKLPIQGEVQKHVEEKSEPPIDPRWWRNVDQIKRVVTILTTSVPILTVLITASVEAGKFASQSADRVVKERTDVREVQLKYVDMALNPTLCLDLRIRIFGFLASSLKDDDERAWAIRELEVANDKEEEVNKLKKQLAEAHAESAKTAVRIAERFVENKKIMGISGKDVSNDMKDANTANIKNLHLSIEQLQGPPCSSTVEASKKS